MGWDRHKWMWDGNGTDKYVPWTTLIIGNLTAVVLRSSVDLTLPILSSIQVITSSVKL